jgi:hypothetical protein
MGIILIRRVIAASINIWIIHTNLQTIGTLLSLDWPNQQKMLLFPVVLIIVAAICFVYYLIVIVLDIKDYYVRK